MSRCEGQTNLGPVARGRTGGRSVGPLADRQERKQGTMPQAKSGQQRWTWKADVGPLVDHPKWSGSFATQRVGRELGDCQFNKAIAASVDERGCQSRLFRCRN